MSKELDVEIFVFFEQAAADEQLEFELDAYNELIESRLTATLKECNAQQLHSRDSDTTSQNRSEAVEYLLNRSAVGEPIEAEATVALRIAHEMTLKAQIRMALAAQDYNQDALIIKKNLQAKLNILNFDQGWTSAINMLLAGPSLDLDTPEDFALYMEVAAREFDTTLPPLVQELTEVLLTGENEAIDPELVDQMLLQELFCHILIAQSDLKRQPNTEAFIDEQFRLGRINSDQVDAIKALLPSTD